jgi:hypothetical protein
MPTRHTFAPLLTLLAAAALVACASAGRPPSHRRRLAGAYARSVSFVWTTDATTSLHFVSNFNIEDIDGFSTLVTAPPPTVPANTSGLPGGLAASTTMLGGVHGELGFGVKSSAASGCTLTNPLRCVGGPVHPAAC